jgi:hypothetical protein
MREYKFIYLDFNLFINLSGIMLQQKLHHVKSGLTLFIYCQNASFEKAQPYRLLQFGF